MFIEKWFSQISYPVCHLITMFWWQEPLKFTLLVILKCLPHTTKYSHTRDIGSPYLNWNFYPIFTSPFSLVLASGTYHSAHSEPFCVKAHTKHSVFVECKNSAMTLLTLTCGCVACFNNYTEYQKDHYQFDVSRKRVLLSYAIGLFVYMNNLFNNLYM